MSQQAYTLSELIAEANKRLADIPELAGVAEFDRRMIYYYANEGLLPRPPSLKKGPRQPYPAEFVDRLIFIRRVQKSTNLPIKSIAEILDQASPDTIARVASGDEPVRITFDSAVKPRESEQMADMRPTIAEEILESPLKKIQAMNADLISPSRNLNYESAYHVDREELPEELSRVFSAGSRGELIVDGPLTPQQEKQLRQAAEMIRTILEDSNED